MSALAPHHPPRLSDRDFATQVEDTLQSCTEAKRVRWWVHYKKLAPLLPDTVTEQMLKTYASADTPKMGSFAERGVLVCTPHRQPYFYVFERGEEIPSYVFWISWMVMMARMMSLMAPLQIVATLTTISLRSSAASALPAISMIRTSLARLLLRATMRACSAVLPGSSQPSSNSEGFVSC